MSAESGTGDRSDHPIRIRAATPTDAEVIQAIERAAGARFADVGLPTIANDDPPSIDTLTDAMAGGHVLVACPVGPDGSTGPTGQAVGWALWELDGTHAHLEQVSVHPDWGGRRIGRDLISAVDAAAAAAGAEVLTLTTFRDVAWNAPLYRRYGFAELRPADWSNAFARRWEAEQAAGLDVAPRIAMMRPTGGL